MYRNEKLLSELKTRYKLYCGIFAESKTVEAEKQFGYSQRLSKYIPTLANARNNRDAVFFFYSEVRAEVLLKGRIDCLRQSSAELAVSAENQRGSPDVAVEDEGKKGIRL
jgi:hypothetical protein